jgi:hypothetical protein
VPASEGLGVSAEALLERFPANEAAILRLRVLEGQSLRRVAGVIRPTVARGAESALAIRQCGWTALTEPRQPLERAAQADPGLRSKVFERDAIIKMPADQAFTTDWCQSGIGVAMHGG